MTRKGVKRKQTVFKGNKTLKIRQTVRGSFVVSKPPIGSGVTVQELEQTAVKVAGNKDAAVRWMDRAHPLLGDLTPREAVERNRGKEALGILLNVAGA